MLVDVEADEQQFPAAEMERTMKVQEVILKGGSWKAEVVGGGRDHGGHTPDDAPVARPAE